MKSMIIQFHIEGTEMPVAIDVSKASKLATELDKQGKKWRLGNTL